MMEPLSSKPRSFFTPKKLYIMQQQQKEQEALEKSHRETATSSDTAATHGRRGEKKLPDCLEDDQLVVDVSAGQHRGKELVHSPTKPRGKTVKHLRLLAALDKEGAKPEPQQSEEDEPTKDEPTRDEPQGVSEPGCLGQGEAEKRPAEEQQTKGLHAKKLCDKKLLPGKDMHALMGTGRGRGRGRGRPPKSSYEPRSQHPATGHGVNDTAQGFNVNPWEAGLRHDKTPIPTHRRSSAGSSQHEGPVTSEHGVRRKSEAAIADNAGLHHTRPSEMCDEITSSADSVTNFKRRSTSVAEHWEPMEEQAHTLSDSIGNLVKVEPDSQRVGNITRSGEQHSCMVCGDIAAGFHCGAYVCEACKKFFVRCLKQEVGNKFMCTKNKMCVVNRETRTQCQFCRYQKCISLGMYKPGSGPGGCKFGAEISHIPCKVCESPSSGYHFGAITCEGCKGFFRRTVKERSGVRYVCSKSGACNITVNTRNVCKSCRYQKCLQAGMTPDGSRIGRQPNAVKHATMLELQRLSGSTPADMGIIEIKQEVASPSSENQDSGFPDNTQFELIDPSNLPEELYLTQSEEEGKLRALKSQPFSPSELLDPVLDQSEPDNLKPYKPAYSQLRDVVTQEQLQFNSHRDQSQFGGHYGGQEHSIPQPRSLRESQPMGMKILGKDIQHQQMQGYCNDEGILRREQIKREQVHREQAQREQVQREQAQRGQALREQAHREQAQREQAHREQVHREQVHREQAHREQAQREQAHREQVHREQVHREQVAARGQSLSLPQPDLLDPSCLRLNSAAQESDAEILEHMQRLARIEALNAEQQELKRQEQQKALELKMEISKLASHSKYMMEISQRKATGVGPQPIVSEKLYHGKVLSTAAAAMDLGTVHRKDGLIRAASKDNASSYTSPDSARFSMSPEESDMMGDDVFEDQHWCVNDRHNAVEQSKDFHRTSVPRPSPPISRSSHSSAMSSPDPPTTTSPLVPTDLSTRSLQRRDSRMSGSRTSGKDCFEIINRVPTNHRILLETITKASLLLRPILNKSTDCKDVDLSATVGEMWETMMGQFNQCAKSVINFARHVPGFLKFPITVQITKVQMAMYPIVLMVLSTQYDVGTREFNYFHMTPEERQAVFKLFPGFTCLGDHFHTMGHSIKFVEMDDIEIAFLCAVVLMTSEAPGSERDAVHPQTESELIGALHIYCTEKEGTDTSRDGYILARLAEVNRCNTEHQRAVFQVLEMYPELKVPQLYEETYLAM